MSQTLFTGATGLLAHQRKLDVVANNLSNLNTTSYKSERVLFADLLYNTISPASGSSELSIGGRNPIQVGRGVNIAQISKDFSQGVLSLTGQLFDFAIQGDGFFVVSGEQQQFTRDGAFSVDSEGFLVSPASGNFVQRFGTYGEGGDGELAFQTPASSKISVPLGVSVPGKATSTSEFFGNLPSSALPPKTEVLITSNPLTDLGAAANEASLLNDLNVNNTDYVAGDTINFVGSDADGTSFSFSLPVDGTSTLGDLVDAVNGELTGAKMTISAEGNLLITANEQGDSKLSLILQDADSNVGGSDLPPGLFSVETDGRNGDTSETTIQVFDSLGQAHAIQIAFEKLSSTTWNANFTSADPAVTLTDGLVANITFNEDGTFQAVAGLGEGDANFTFEIDGLTDSQTVSVGLENLTQLASSYSATFEQDGVPPGTIVSVNVSAEGLLTGIATNGRRLPVAQLAVANFANANGLESVGQNLFIQSSNSGLPNIGAARSGGSGEIRGGQLETSNVDVALEFTQLIVAQRGFSANARVITVASEVLQELTNIIR